MNDELNPGHAAEPHGSLRLAVGTGRPPQPPQSSSAERPAIQPSSPAPTQRDWADGGHLLDYLKVLHKRRWTATTAFLLVVGGIMLYTFTATPIYEARTRLLIEADNPNIISFKEVIDEQGAKADYYQTQYNILQSRILAHKTLDALQLWDNPYLQPGRGPGFFARLLGDARDQHSPRLAASSGESPEQSRAIDRFLANLTVSPIRNSRLVDIRFRLPDPELATRVVNALAKNYIQQNLEYRFVASKEASDWLGERLDENRKQFE